MIRLLKSGSSRILGEAIINGLNTLDVSIETNLFILAAASVSLSFANYLLNRTKFSKQQEHNTSNTKSPHRALYFLSTFNLAFAILVFLSLLVSIEVLGPPSNILLAISGLVLSNGLAASIHWLNRTAERAPEQFIALSEQADGAGKTRNARETGKTRETGETEEPDSQQQLFTQQELLQLQARASIGTYSYRVAHNFNNVLTIILANTEMLSLKLSEEPDKKKHLLKIQTSVATSREFLSHISQLMDGATPEANENVSVAEIAQATITLLEKILPAEANLTYASSLNEARCQTSAHLIKQGIFHLTTLCHQSLRESKGTIQITAREIHTADNPTWCRFKFGNFNEEGQALALPDSLRRLPESASTRPRLESHNEQHSSDLLIATLLATELKGELTLFRCDDIHCGYELSFPLK